MISDLNPSLYDYGFRDYSPVQMRFTSVDPIRDGLNWYAYVSKDPINLIDPFGLCSESDDPLVGFTLQFGFSGTGTAVTAGLGFSLYVQFDWDTG